MCPDQSTESRRRLSRAARRRAQQYRPSGNRSSGSERSHPFESGSPTILTGTDGGECDSKFSCAYRSRFYTDRASSSCRKFRLANVKVHGLVERLPRGGERISGVIGDRGIEPCEPRTEHASI